MKHKYKNLRGLEVDEAFLQRILQNIGKTEDEIIEFIGEDVVTEPGFFYYVVEGLHSAIMYFRGK